MPCHRSASVRAGRPRMLEPRGLMAAFGALALFVFEPCAPRPSAEEYERTCHALSPAVPPPAALQAEANAALASILRMRETVRQRGVDWTRERFTDAVEAPLGAASARGVPRLQFLGALAASAARSRASNELVWIAPLMASDPEGAEHASELMALPADSAEQVWRPAIAVLAVTLQREPPLPSASGYFEYTFCRLMTVLTEEARRPGAAESVALGLDTPSVVIPGWLLWRLWTTGRRDEQRFVRSALSAAPATMGIGDALRGGFESRRREREGAARRN